MFTTHRRWGLEVPNHLYTPQRGPFPIEQKHSAALVDPRTDRIVPVAMTWPDVSRGDGHPLILWSHGATGNKTEYGPLVEFLAEHGYVVAQPDHSDANKDREDPTKLRDWKLRPGELSLLLDSITELSADVPGLDERIDAERVGVGGHSFGANTAQLLGGTRLRDGTSFADDRVAAVVLMSPQGVGGMFDEHAWDHFTRPMLNITGTHDPGPSPDGLRPWPWRTAPFTSSPPGDKYLIVIDGADHGFGGTGGSRGREVFGWPDNDQHVAIVQAAVTAFYDAVLLGSARAREWLEMAELLRLAPEDIAVHQHRSADRERSGAEHPTLRTGHEA